MHEGEHRGDQHECEDAERSEEVTFEEGALRAREAEEQTEAEAPSGRLSRWVAYNIVTRMYALRP